MAKVFEMCSKKKYKIKHSRDNPLGRYVRTLYTLLRQSYTHTAHNSFGFLFLLVFFFNLNLYF